MNRYAFSIFFVISFWFFQHANGKTCYFGIGSVHHFGAIGNAVSTEDMIIFQYPRPFYGSLYESNSFGVDPSYKPIELLICTDSVKLREQLKIAGFIEIKNLVFRVSARVSATHINGDNGSFTFGGWFEELAHISSPKTAEHWALIKQALKNPKDAVANNPHLRDQLRRAMEPAPFRGDLHISSEVVRFQAQLIGYDSEGSRVELFENKGIENESTVEYKNPFLNCSALFKSI